jgi:hypothetical protein
MKSIGWTCFKVIQRKEYRYFYWVIKVAGGKIGKIKWSINVYCDFSSERCSEKYGNKPDLKIISDGSFATDLVCV